MYSVWWGADEVYIYLPYCTVQSYVVHGDKWINQLEKIEKN